ncbi:MAG: crossover junction endodeoxyribonuclease RuvC [Deltaproteobacteria bacterium]|nr:crossover junction endodeoxyribonuclease RuvC [Deltaproteobacteria bacterium]
MKRVLGVDPGTLRTGWGVVERRGTRMLHLGHGVIQPAPGLDLADRLLAIFDGLGQVLAEHAPAYVAVEDVFHARFAQAALKLGHARGVSLLCAARAGLSVRAYPPALVKRTIAGYGRADKTQVQRMVTALLGLDEIPPVDAADALAIAICHCNAIEGIE